MTPQLMRLFACGLGVGVLALPAHALQIEGLHPFEPVAAEMVTPAISAQTLKVPLPQQGTLSIAPWPAYLPQRFTAQSMRATRQLHPAGPADRVSFSTKAGKPAWLEIGSGARPSTAIVGGWRLELSARGWSIKRGSTQFMLGDSERNAQPAAVSAGRERWCIYLLDAKTPRPQAGIATEQEAQMSWAALRLDARQKRCPAQRAATR